MLWIFDRFRVRSILQLFGMIFGIVYSFDVMAQDAINTREPLQNSTLQNASIRSNALSHKPHPWLNDMPPAFARLVDIGRVEIAVDQAAVDAANRTALTVFSFSLAYQMKYRFNEITKGDDGKRRVRITVSYFDVDVSPAHRILLSESYRPTKPWDAALMQHEFDHVAISTDPRMFAMLLSLNAKKAILIANPNELIKISDDWVKGQIENSSKDFQQAVEKLVQTYYVRLDDVSNHGLKTIEDRTRFFTELFTLEDLAKSKFAYLDNARKSLPSINPDQIKQHYRLP